MVPGGYGYGPPSGYGPPPTSMRQEMTLLVEQGVQVTTARFVVYQQTYPIAGLTSVAPFAQPAQRGGAILGAVVFALTALMFFSLEVYAVGLILGALTALCIFIAATKKDTFGVVIWTAGTNMRALVSPDGAFVSRVLGALNQAIAMR